MPTSPRLIEPIPMTPSPGETRRNYFGPTLAKTLGLLGGLFLVLAFAFFCYFIAPKLEASWKSRGERPSFFVLWLVRHSGLSIQYFWIIAIAGLAVWKMSRPKPPQRDEHRHD